MKRKSNNLDRHLDDLFESKYMPTYTRNRIGEQRRGEGKERKENNETLSSEERERERGREAEREKKNERNAEKEKAKEDRPILTNH